MTWTDSVRRAVESGQAAPVSIPGIEAPCVVVRKDVFDRLKQEEPDFEDGDLVDADPETWIREFDEWLKGFPPGPAYIDDSRDSIYGDDRVP